MGETRLRVVGGADAEGLGESRSQGQFRFRDDGWLEALDGSVWKTVCSPCRVLALTRDDDNRNWGRLVSVEDPDGRIHQIAIACRLMSGRGEPAVDLLLGLGLQLEPSAKSRNALLRYLGATTTVDGAPLARALAAGRTGWHRQTFVLPRGAIGVSGLAVYQPSSVLVAALRSRGTLEDWQASVAQPVIGNSRLVLALSAAVAAPLLGALGYPEGFGIHLRGASSTGKTTALEIAGSVWGGGGLTGYRQSWHATANGIEAMAEAHCDVLLCLDELGQVRPEEAGRVAYQLATGTGRQRALSDGMAASRREWRLIYLSTGEIGLADKMREARYPLRMMAGQAVRFIDLPADAEAGSGIFEAWPAAPDAPDGTARTRGRAFADRLIAAAHGSYGTAGPAFVERFIRDRESALDQVRQVIDEMATTLAPRGADGQVQRVARHLALVGAAGELAIGLEVLPWPTGEAVRAVERCFADWVRARGTIGSAEADDTVSYLRGIIERDGASRFQRLRSNELGHDRLETSDPVHNRLGFIREDDREFTYLFPSETWKMLMAGRDPNRAARLLLEMGILEPGDSGHLQPKVRLPGCKNPQRVYAVRHSRLFGETGDGEAKADG